MCISVEYMCVKFGWKSARGYRNFSKTAQGVIFMGHPVYAHDLSRSETQLIDTHT